MKRTSIALLALLGCSAASNPESQIPAAARPAWTACRDAVVRRCRDQYNGDPQSSIQCEESEAMRYRALGTEAERTEFLRARGCTTIPNG